MTPTARDLKPAAPPPGLIEPQGREVIGNRIVEGYRRVPQTEAEMGWADDATIRMIAEETW